VQQDRTVWEMAEEVLERQAKALAHRSGLSLEDARRAVADTQAGRQLRDLASGEHALPCYPPGRGVAPAPPGSYGRTTDAPAQRFKGAMRRPRQEGVTKKRGHEHYKGRSPVEPQP